MGKTGFACSVATHAAYVWKKGVFYFTFEDSAPAVAGHVISAETQVGRFRIEHGHLSREERDRCRVAVQNLVTAPLSILEGRGLSHVVDRLRMAGGADLVIVDSYERLLDAGGLSVLRTARTRLVNYMRDMSQVFACLVILMTKISRAADDRMDHRPRLSDLPAAVANGADCVLALHRNNYYEEEGWRQPRSVCEVHVLKHRLDPSGVVRLTFIKDCARFENFGPDLAAQA
jgi:replicative DNA helicase